MDLPDRAKSHGFLTQQKQETQRSETESADKSANGPSHRSSDTDKH